MFLLNGKPILADAAFTSGDINYPSGWIRFATPEARAAVGITEVPDPVRPDDRFYWVTWNEATLDYTKTPKDLAEVKKQMLFAIRQQANAALSPTDWMVIRKAELGEEIPAEWEAYRSDIRIAVDDAEALLAACVTVDEVAAVKVDMPESPDATKINKED